MPMLLFSLLLAVLPALGPARPVEPGVVVHQVSLAHGASAGRIWIYLPDQLPAKKKLPCIFIAPAGAVPFVGNSFGPQLDRERYPEHVPYVHAGFAVVAYDVDGDMAERVTNEELRDDVSAFMRSEAGMVNARNAIDYVLKNVPAIDPKRLYAVGHSSAGREALLLAESDPRIAACVAYAPVTDPAGRAQHIAGFRYLEANIPGIDDFLHRTSPLEQAAKLKCPLFLFHSMEDQRIAIADTDRFAEAVKKTNKRVTYVRATHGGHYDSMINEGLPQGLAWLRALPR